MRWRRSRGDPYPLYAASNLGSFAGLIAYPLLVEPLLTPAAAELAVDGGLCPARPARRRLRADRAGARPVEAMPRRRRAPPPTARRILHWIALAAVPSGLMLSTTTHLTTDIVAMPLLWVLPLGLYLLSFVVAFADAARPGRFITMLAPLVILIAGGLAFSDGAQQPALSRRRSACCCCSSSRSRSTARCTGCGPRPAI